MSNAATRDIPTARGHPTNTLTSKELWINSHKNLNTGTCLLFFTWFHKLNPSCGHSTHNKKASLAEWGPFPKMPDKYGVCIRSIHQIKLAVGDRLLGSGKWARGGHSGQLLCNTWIPGCMYFCKNKPAKTSVFISGRGHRGHRQKVGEPPPTACLSVSKHKLTCPPPAQSDMARVSR